MSITIKDIAQKAGVSKSTISRYCNGQMNLLKPETKARVSAVINEFNYQPNSLARSLKQKRTYTVGAIISNILNPFSTSIIRGMEDYCNEMGFSLILCNADDNPAKEKKYIEVLVAKQIDGLLITTTECNNELLLQVQAKIPVVVIARKVPHLKGDTVTINNAAGVRMAVRHLVELGHRSICMFSLPYKEVNRSPRAERVKAYREALAENGLEFRKELLVESDTAPNNVEAQIERLLKLRDRPTAILGSNDLITMALVRALKQLRIAIPGQLALTGFDDWDWASVVEPPVTVVAQPSYEMGRKAAVLLVKRIESPEKPRKARTHVYQPQLIIRASCGEDSE